MRGERKRKRERKTICDQTKISLRHQFDIEKTASKEERKRKEKRHFPILTFLKSTFLWNVCGLIAGGGCYITQAAIPL